MPKAASLFLIRYGTQFAARNVRFLAQSGHALVHCKCPLSGVDITTPFATEFPAIKSEVMTTRD